MSKIWYITGASKGLGLALAKKLLASGHKVVATSRNKKELIKAIDAGGNSSFLPLEVDLTNDDSVSASMSVAVEHFGTIDVVVNNAGYGIAGTIEELSMQEMGMNVEVNLTATLRVIHFAMPYLRNQRSGHIINISSVGGMIGPLGWPIYAATKAAVIAYTEVLAQDVKEFGVKVTVIAPGRFRTSFLGDSLIEAKETIADYTAVRELQAKVKASGGTQTGDPDKAADVMIALTENPEPPVLLFLGADAYDRAAKRASDLQTNLEENKHISFSTDF